MVFNTHGLVKSNTQVHTVGKMKMLSPYVEKNAKQIQYYEKLFSH